MNKFKIEATDLFKKEFFVEAKDEKQALNFVEKIFFKTNLLDLDAKILEETKFKITEKNGQKIEENEDYFEDDFYENDDEDSCENERDYY